MRTILAVSACLLLGMTPVAEACDQCAYVFNAPVSEDHPAGAMITTPTARTLGQGHAAVSFLFEQQRFNSIPAADAHALHEDGHDIHGKNHEERYQVTLGYGLLEDLDLFATLPIVSRTSIQVEDHDALGRGERAAGVGDLRLTGKYRFWKQGADVAALLGVKTPTGETADRDQSGEKMDVEQQPGSGGWDVTAGLTASRSFGTRCSLASAFQYTYRGEGGQDYKAGDVFRYDLGTSVALRRLGRTPNLHVVLELQGQWALRDRDRGGTVADSGGMTLLINPGLVADLGQGVSAFWSMPIPIYQNLGGQHEELVYELITGLSWRF